MKALVGALNQEKGAFSVIVQLHRLIDLRHYPALGLQHRRGGLQLRERGGGAAAVRGHGHHHRRGQHGGHQAGRRLGQL